MGKPTKSILQQYDGLMECHTCQHWKQEQSFISGQCRHSGLHCPPRHTCEAWTLKHRPVGRPKKGGRRD